MEKFMATYVKTSVHMKYSVNAMHKYTLEITINRYLI